MNSPKFNRYLKPSSDPGSPNLNIVASLCCKFKIPFAWDAWPYSSGIQIYCEDDALWKQILLMAKPDYDNAWMIDHDEYEYAWYYRGAAK